MCFIKIKSGVAKMIYLSILMIKSDFDTILTTLQMFDALKWQQSTDVSVNMCRHHEFLINFIAIYSRMPFETTVFYFPPLQFPFKEHLGSHEHNL